MKERLIELLSGKSLDTTADVEYVAEFLLENGVEILPCKVGEKVYQLYTLSRQEMYRRGFKPDVEHKRQRGCPIRFYKYHLTEVRETTMKRSWYKDFGKTIFLTYEEADKALEEMSKERGGEIIEV